MDTIKVNGYLSVSFAEYLSKFGLDIEIEWWVEDHWAARVNTNHCMIEQAPDCYTWLTNVVVGVK